MTPPTDHEPLTPPPSPMPPPSRWKLDIHPVVVFLAVMLLVIRIIRGVSAHMLAYEMGSLVFGVIVACIIAGVLYFVLGRSARAFNVTLGVLLAAGVAESGYTIWHGANAARRASSNEVAGTAARAVEDVKRQYREQVRAKGNTQTDTNPTDNAAESDADLAARLEEEETMIAVAAAAVTAEFNDKARAMAQMIEQYIDMGTFEAGRFQSLDDVDEQLQFIAEFAAANADLDQVVRGAPSRFRNLLADNDISDARLLEAQQAYILGTKHDLQVRLREAETRFAAAATDYLTVLRDHWGKWSVSQESGAVAFEDEAAQREFDAAAHRLATTVHDEAEIRNKLFDVPDERPK